MQRLQSGLSLLATVGATAPFVGLFGTVWGIMHSFTGIAVAKDTSLAVVAPGIAEALFATAIGLAAAIPAVIFYNQANVLLGNVAARMTAAVTKYAKSRAYGHVQQRTGFRMPAMAGPSARTGRRPESAEARNRGVLVFDGAATLQRFMGIQRARQRSRTPICRRWRTSWLTWRRTGCSAAREIEPSTM
jgi:hypothetical protein